MSSVDKVIIGGGLYGLYSALYCAKRGQNIVVLEYDKEAFSRATYVNQARVHNGYHYPRSYSTAVNSAKYFDRFNKDFGFCIHDSFTKIYATSSVFSWTSAQDFKKFCDAAQIKCDSISVEKYFKDDVCDGAFETEEFTFDAMMLRDYFVKEIAKYPNCEIIYQSRMKTIDKIDGQYVIKLNRGRIFETKFVLNATYGSLNQILSKFNFEHFKMKYELCEIILCKVSDNIKNVGLTLMDGPFFSLMPFGKTGYHSLTSVLYTPHKTSTDPLPVFKCQVEETNCSPTQLNNCNLCINKPESSWWYMSNLAKKYLKDDIKIEFIEALFSIKAVLQASEIDDSRPTIVKQFSESPDFFSVFSGKINTIYDLDEILEL